MNETTEQTETSVEQTQPIAATERAAAREPNGFKRFFTARRIAYIATFTALAFALRFLQFPILTAVPYLKFDFSDAIVLIAAYALGPVSGLIIGIMKETIYGIFFTGTAFVGEAANIIIMIPFVLLPSIIYKKHKGLKSVVLWLSVACLVRTAWSFPVNLLLNFPVFLGFNWKLGMDMFMSVWYWATLFNFIKNIILACVVLLLYKSVSRFIHMINAKFDSRRARAVSDATR